MLDSPEPIVVDEAVEKASKTTNFFEKSSLGIIEEELEKATERNQNLDLIFDFPWPVKPVHFESFIIPNIGIKAAYLDGNIIVWLPRLPPKRYRISPKASKNLYSYGHCYADEVGYVMSQLSRELDPKILKSFTTKTICFYFTYPSNSGQVNDSDNHDTKAITDTITSYLPNGDTAQSCNFFYQTVFSDELRSGTYVVVCTGSEPKSFTKIVLPSLNKFGLLNKSKKVDKKVDFPN